MSILKNGLSQIILDRKADTMDHLTLIYTKLRLSPGDDNQAGIRVGELRGQAGVSDMWTGKPNR